MARKPSHTSTCSQDSLYETHNDSGVDVAEFIPPISSTFTSEVPDSVLLMSMMAIGNPEASSTVSHLSFVAGSRTKFYSSEIAKEKETNAVIHHFFCHSRVPNSGLYELVMERMGQRAPFISNIGFEDYIKARPFLFGADPDFRNQGFGYIDGIRKMAHYVDAKSQSDRGCVLKEFLEEFVPTLPVYPADNLHVPWDDSWFSEKPLTKEEVIYILSIEQRGIFHVQGIETDDVGQMVVRLTQNAYNIPSLWHDECVPPLPTELLWDESRVFKFRATVTFVHEHHSMATIQSGTFRGRILYIHRSRVGPNDLRTFLHIGTLIDASAHITLNTNSQFRALKITVINDYPTLEVRKIGGGRQHQQQEREHLEIRVPQPNRNNQQCPISSHYRLLLARAAESERQMIRFADELIAGTMYSFDGLQRRLVKYKFSHRNSPFATYSDLEYFLSQRPHLYTYNQLGASCAGERDREVAIAFIEMVSEFGFVGAPKKELRNRLVVGCDLLQGIVAEGSLDEYILKISPVLEVVRLANPVEELVMLRGTYIKEQKLFVHHFKPAFMLPE